MIINNRVLTHCTIMLVLSASTIAGQDPLRYREFPLGSNVASIGQLTGTLPAAAKVIHSRPAVIRELEWRPRYSARGESTQTDPVDLITFRFYEDQLFMIVVDYDRRRTEGMSPADMVAAMTATYGPTSRLASRPIGLPTSQYGFPDTPLAIWENTASSITLLRVAYPEAFRLAVTSTHLDDLARRAIAAAVRMDALEAPQREIARQKKEADDALAAQEKVKAENKALFKP